MGIRVLGPDINESFYKFNVNEDKAIRFGMGAIKGVGKGAVETIVQNRKDGDYKDIYDFSIKGHKYYNGKILPVSISNP